MFFLLVCLNLESPVVVLYSAASEQERLWDVLSEKRNQIRILSRQDESKRKKVKEAEIKVSIISSEDEQKDKVFEMIMIINWLFFFGFQLIEKAATVLSEEIQV